MCGREEGGGGDYREVSTTNITGLKFTTTIFRQPISSFLAHLVQIVQVHHGRVSLDRDHLHPRPHDLRYLRVLHTWDMEHERGGGGGVQTPNATGNNRKHGEKRLLPFVLLSVKDVTKISNMVALVEEKKSKTKHDQQTDRTYHKHR